MATANRFWTPHWLRKLPWFLQPGPALLTRIFSTLGVQVKSGFWETLPAAGLDHIEISLYGWDRESYITFHGVDRFDLAMQNLAYLSHVSHVSHARAEKISIRSWYCEGFRFTPK